MLRNQIDKIRLIFRKDRESYFCFYKILGFFPRNIRFYQQALLHKSTSVRSEKGRPLNNERLEFLGDAILDAIVGRMETQYLKPIHTTDSHLTLKGRIKEQKRNFVFIEAEIYNAQDEVCTKAVCTYFIFPREKAEKEMYFKGCYTEKEKESL